MLAPGEQITAAATEALREAVAHGTRVAYAADPPLATLRVLRSSTSQPTTRGHLIPGASPAAYGIARPPATTKRRTP
ncbi:hypothetical protein IDVR_25830 [Intrasporangium sp. DVR]